MKVSRRIFLGAAAAFAALRGRAARASTIIDTLTLYSTSGSTVAANAIPPMFGLQFAKGAVPSGTYPQLQATDGTPWGCTFTNRRSWSDGSWRSCGVLPGPFPKAITTGGVTANVLNGGSAPASSGLTNTQLYNELIQANLAGFAGALGTGLNLTGSWAAKLANDANNVEVVVYGDGQGGRLLRVLCHFESGGTAHGQLECYFYVQQLLDSVGGLAGYRVLPRVCQPWYNVDSPAKTYLRGIQTFTLQYGAGPTTVTPPFPLSSNTISWNSGTQFTATSNNWYLGGSQTFAGDGIIYGYFTTTGTLPSGISLNTLYPLNVFPLSVSNTVNTFVTPTDGGSGTHTFNPCNVITHFGTLWGANSAAKYNYIQGAGSVSADAQVRVAFNATNRRATGCFPPLDLSLSPTPNANAATFQGFTYAWSTQMIGPLYWNIGHAGERYDIGLLNTYQCRHFFNQTATDELYVRMMGLATAYMSNCLRDMTTRGPVNLADPANTYTGVPASTANTLNWDTQYGYADGFTAPSGLNFAANLNGSLIFNTNETHHQPHMAGFAYLVTGEPQYLDLEMEVACTMGAAGWTADSLRVLPRRNPTLNSTNYFGVLSYESDNIVRKQAWAIRAMVFAEGLWPDTDPAGTQIGTLLHDLRSIQFRFANLWLAAANSYLKSTGQWIPLCQMDNWTTSYMAYVACLAVTMCEDTEALTFLNSLATYYNHVGATFSYWQLDDFFRIAFKSTNLQPGTLPDTTFPDGNPLSSDDELVSGTGVDGIMTNGFSWTVGANPAFTWTFGGQNQFNGFVPTNGDKVRMPAYKSFNVPNPLPGGFSPNTSYFARDVDVVTGRFNLAATPGGTPIAPTGSSSDTNTLGTLWGMTAKAPVQNPPMFSSYAAQDGYLSNRRGSQNFMITAGVSNMATVAADMETRHNNMLAIDSLTAGQFYVNNPKYAMAALGTTAASGSAMLFRRR